LGILNSDVYGGVKRACRTVVKILGEQGHGKHGEREGEEHEKEKKFHDHVRVIFFALLMTLDLSLARVRIRFCSPKIRQKIVAALQANLETAFKRLELVIR